MADQSAAKLLATTSALLLSGYGIASSQNILPLLYDLPPSTSTALFKGVFQRGISPVVTGAFLSVSASVYLAYSSSRQRGLHITAALLPASALAMTRIFMMSGIERLIELSGSGGVDQAHVDTDGEVLRLLQAWTMQNWIRASLYLASGSASLSTILNP